MNLSKYRYLEFYFYLFFVFYRLRIEKEKRKDEIHRIVSYSKGEFAHGRRRHRCILNKNYFTWRKILEIVKCTL